MDGVEKRLAEVEETLWTLIAWLQRDLGAAILTTHPRADAEVIAGQVAAAPAPAEPVQAEAVAMGPWVGDRSVKFLRKTMDEAADKSDGKSHEEKLHAGLLAVYDVGVREGRFTAPIAAPAPEPVAGKGFSTHAEVADEVRHALVIREAVLPEQPPLSLLVSMALRVNHGFGLDDIRSQQVQLSDMRKVYEEVSGQGFYRRERAELYRGLVKGSDTAAPFPDPDPLMAGAAGLGGIDALAQTEDAAPAPASEPSTTVAITDEQIVLAIRNAGAERDDWQKFCYSSGPYEITTPRVLVRRIIGEVLKLVAAPAQTEPMQEEAVAHSDHPLRNFDRTCPACIAGEYAATESDLGRPVRPHRSGGGHPVEPWPMSPPPIGTPRVEAEQANAAALWKFARRRLEEHGTVEISLAANGDLSFTPKVEAVQESNEIQRLRAGLQWYADGKHCLLENEWESEEGWLCPPPIADVTPEPGWMVEPGGVARAILEGMSINPDGDADEIVVHTPCMKSGERCVNGQY